VIHPNDNNEEELFDSQGMPTLSGDEYPLDNHYQNRHEGRMRGIDDLHDGFLTECEIVNNLGLERGRAELQEILLEGAVARDTLIRSNIRLVISIAKRWARQLAKYNNPESSKEKVRIVLAFMLEMHSHRVLMKRFKRALWD